MSGSTAHAALDDFGGLIDWPKLNAWLESQDVPGSGPVTGAKKLKGGVHLGTDGIRLRGARYGQR